MTNLKEVEGAIWRMVMFLSATKLPSPIVEANVTRVVKLVELYGDAREAAAEASNCDGCERIERDSEEGRL